MQRIEAEGVWAELNAPHDDADPDQLSFVEIDPSRCIGCDSCQRYCPVDAIQGASGRPHSIPHKEVCIRCGQCIVHCPQGAVYEAHSYLLDVARRLDDTRSVCIAVPDPAVRCALGEAFGIPAGVSSSGKMRAAAMALGFDHCWDGAFFADVLARELSHEFVRRLEQRKNLPLMTSACAGWQSYCELYSPDLLSYLSECMSPLAMGGMLAKTYGAEQMGYDPSGIYTVAVSSCTAFKYEALRPELRRGGAKFTDAVLTTREFAFLLKKAGIDFVRLQETEEDPLMGEYSGAAAISCAPGGLAESVLRCVYQLRTGEKPERLDFMPLRGMDGFRSASLNIGGLEIKVAVVHGAKNFAAFADSVRKGNSPYHFVECTACPGGCLCGGGQPVFPSVREVFEHSEEVFF